MDKRVMGKNIVSDHGAYMNMMLEEHKYYKHDIQGGDDIIMIDTIHSNTISAVLINIRHENASY
eukprot:3800405-Ditylum_brightwellii.AAC.1